MATSKLELPGGLRVVNAVPVDAKYFNNVDTPYTNTAQVFAQIPVGIRYAGLTVNVAGVEYWWAPSGTVTDVELIVKAYGSTSTFSNGLTLASGNVKLGGTLVNNTIIDGSTGTYSLTIRDTSSFTVDEVGGYSTGGLTIFDNGGSLAIKLTNNTVSKYVELSGDTGGGGNTSFKVVGTGLMLGNSQANTDQGVVYFSNRVGSTVLGAGLSSLHSNLSTLYFTASSGTVYDLLASTTGGHTIKVAGTTLAQRTNLNFTNGFTGVDDLATDTTRVKLGGTITENLSFIDAGGGYTFSVYVEDVNVVSTTAHIQGNNSVTLKTSASGDITLDCGALNQFSVGQDFTIVGSPLTLFSNPVPYVFGVTDGDLFYDTTKKDVFAQVNGQWTGMTRSEILTEASTTLTINESHRNKVIRFTNVNPITVTLSTLSIGLEFDVIKAPGAGTITLSTVGVLDAISSQLILDNSAATVVSRGSNNWMAFGGLGTGGGSSTLFKQETFSASGSVSAFTVVGGTIDQLLTVFVNGVQQNITTHFTRTGQVIDFGTNPPAGASIVIMYFEDLSVSGGGGASYTFQNGVNESVGIVKLGGTLTSNTTIDGSSTYGLSLDSLSYCTINSPSIYLGGEVQVGNFPFILGSGSSNPSSAPFGALFYNSADAQIYYSVNDGAGWKKMFRNGTLVSSAVITLSTNQTTYSFNGAIARVWDLPTLASSFDYTFQIKNKGTANLTLDPSGAETLYDAGALSTFVLLPGEACIIDNDGVHWVIVSKSSSGGVGAGAATIVRTNVAYVETTGNDGTGVLGRSDKPFLTITGALAAGVGSTTLVIKIGLGDFAVPFDDSGLDGTSVLRNNVTFEGTKRPETDSTFTIGTFPAYPTMSAPTKLQNGTVLKGRFSHVNRKNIVIKNLGVDVGSAFCTATGGSYINGGNCIGFGDASSGTGSAATGMNTGIVIENVAALGRNSTALYHGLVMENCLEPRVSNVYMWYNTHGFVSKNQGGIYDGIYAHGHASNGIIIKSNVYAGQQKEILTNFQVRSIATLDSGGVYIFADSAAMSDLQVSNGVVLGCTYGVRVHGISVLNRVDIENVKSISNTVDGFKTEGTLVQKVNFINCTANANGNKGFNITTGDTITLTSPRSHSNGSDGIYSTATNALANDIYAQSNGGYGLNVNSGIFYRLTRFYRLNSLGGENGIILNNNGSGQGLTYTDTFNRANSSTSLGSLESPITPWVVAVGTFGITSNKAYNSSVRDVVAQPSQHALVDVGVSEGTMDLYVTADNTDAFFTLVFRYLNASNFMTCNFTRTAGGAVGTALYKNIAGTFTFIAGTQIASVWTGAGQHKISIFWTGTTVSLSVDDVLQYNINTSTTGLESNTKVGFGQYTAATGGDDGGTLYEDFTFRSLGEATQNDGIVADTLINGVTYIAPSQNAVFDALALKANAASPLFTGPISFNALTGTTGQVLTSQGAASSPIWAGSGITRSIVVTSGSATMGATASTDYVYLVAALHTMTLPTAVGNTNRYTIKNNHSVNITVNTTSSQTIDGTTTITIAPQASVDIISNTTNWNII